MPPAPLAARCDAITRAAANTPTHGPPPEPSGLSRHQQEITVWVGPPRLLSRRLAKGPRPRSLKRRAEERLWRVVAQVFKLPGATSALTTPPAD